jgi:hypothetical protein
MTVKVTAAVVALDKQARHYLICNAWTEGKLAYSAKKSIFNNMPYVRYIDLTKARERIVHKDYDRKN